jgi:thioredoxin reductase
MNPERRKIAIIGAGPVGLEAALTALERGYEINLYERGEIADAVRQWGHVHMFSPFEMNTSQGGLARLHVAGVSLPRPEMLQTGAQFRETYLLPLARILAPHVQENCEVRAIGRSRRLKGDFIADPLRGRAPFRLLLQDSNGERTESADVVLDCSGTFAQPNSLGDGGIPVPGEAASSARVHYGIPNFSNGARDRFAGRRVLVIGAGHSAATAISALAEIQRQPEMTWLIRRECRVPAVEIPNDPLPERSQLAAIANRLARGGQVRLLTGASIEGLAPKPDGIEVHWSDPRGRRSTLLVDEIIAATGFRPDLTLTRELQVQTCWATEGTYPLAASLLGETAADCLAAPAGGAEMLLHPEPGYFTVGMKSYGRSPNFLLRTGYEQVSSVFDWLAREGKLTAL